MGLGEGWRGGVGGGGRVTANIRTHIKYWIVWHYFGLDLCLQGHTSNPKPLLSSTNHKLLDCSRWYIHLRKYTLFLSLTLWPIYAPEKFEVATSNSLGGDSFTRKYIIWVKVTQNVAQYHLYHVTYTLAKFEVATSNGLEGDTFTRKNHLTFSDLALWFKV